MEISIGALGAGAQDHRSGGRDPRSRSQGGAGIGDPAARWNVAPLETPPMLLIAAMASMKAAVVAAAAQRRVSGVAARGEARYVRAQRPLGVGRVGGQRTASISPARSFTAMPCGITVIKHNRADRDAGA
jgi:hypothetical protein